MNLAAGALFSLTTSRGWIVNPVVLITYNILTIILGLLILDVSTIEGILGLNIFIGAGQVLMLVVFFFIKLLKMRKI
ncbi:MAG: hypothetical protein EOO85_31255 [Pedobacter sp.]|nr:MAG: hypothetical protein EOO85_31255 [Pedobacter sp.]